MRQALVAGAFALLLSGTSFGVAHANGADQAVQSPDVAAWTAHLTVSNHDKNVRGFAGGVLARTSKMATALTKSALRFLGVPYVFGGTSTSGFDCSGYVQHVFAMLGVSVPRTADAQYYAGAKIRGGMRPGDLVFFQTYEPGPSHVGIYLGNGEFAHASSSHGVTISSLSDAYWRARYIGAKRLLASR